MLKTSSDNRVVFNLSSDCQLDFIFPRILKDRGKIQSLVASLELTMPPPNENVIFKSHDTSVLLEDWVKLCNYLEKHMIDQQVDYPQRSPEFAPHGLLFMFHALRGEVYSEIEGHFRLRVMLQTGYDPTHHFRRSVGIDTIVAVAEVTRFVAELRAYLNDVQLDDETKQP